MDELITPGGPKGSDDVYEKAVFRVTIIPK